MLTMNSAFQESLDSATADGASQMDKQLEKAGNAGMHDHSSMFISL